MLELRPAKRVELPGGGVRHPLALGRTGLQTKVQEALTGTPLAFLRDGARVLRGSFRHALRLRFVEFASRVFSLQRRAEIAFLASGAATQLADAALEGEHTPELAARIARIARDLSEATGAAVHLRSPGGLQKLGAHGEPCPEALATAALQSGRVEWGGRTAAVPLRVRDELVGTLSLCFEKGRRDLRPLQPLLARAGAVLVAAEREARKDRFLSVAAHELKTPLTSIKGFSYSLARRLERGETCDPRHVQVLERQAERLHALLEEMLEVSRIETGRFVLHQEPCELAEVVEASHRSLRRLGAEADLGTRVDAALPLIVDRERIERALTALVLRARVLGGPVRIDAQRRDGKAHLRVSWTGEALPQPEREAAFEARWDVPQVQRQGLGMALFIAREVAELHGGSLRAEERSFLMELPLRTPSRAPRSGAGEGRVLVVDDDEPIARMMAEFLSEHGFVADWAGGGHPALEKVRTEPPDLIVLDLHMPDLDGRGVLAAVRARGLSPRVVLFSADRLVAAAALELACEAFVEKPFAPESLLAAVRRSLKPREAK